MASPKHLDLLSSGKTLWNTWRREYADEQALEPDLHEADLHGADLRGVDFFGVDLTEANLQGADLRGADLEGAMLSKAIFDEALVSRVGPGGADLDTFDSPEAERIEVRA